MMASLADNETETTYGVAPVAYAGFHDDESVNSGDNDITIISDDNDATRLYIDPALLGKSVPLMDEIMVARGPLVPCNVCSGLFDDQFSHSEVSTIVPRKLEYMAEPEVDAALDFGVPGFIDDDESLGSIDMHEDDDTTKHSSLEHERVLETEQDDEAKALNSLFTYLPHFDMEVGIVGAEALLFPC
ncbi:hypothetical protein IV203_029245 [Nitzschia inconspicua]|uniref:Uncharacterized protein n=1 Tax=Nitzschia inconspicua TaxID=303405 RepID=A0A9K3LQ93_9STRA|nr:hypothetical protein IV203_029245 [Nitzschia inconspicua]